MHVLGVYISGHIYACVLAIDLGYVEGFALLRVAILVMWDS